MLPFRRRRLKWDVFLDQASANELPPRTPNAVPRANLTGVLPWRSRGFQPRDRLSCQRASGNRGLGRLEPNSASRKRAGL